VTYTGVKLRWNYGADGLGNGDNVEVSVMAIEMVYVPQGAFYVGSGGIEPGAFYTYPTTTQPYHITSEDGIILGTNNGNLNIANPGFSSGNILGPPIPAAFPKGFNAFYCMKYEITQAQYVAFLNKLTYAQQESRTVVSPASAVGTLALTTPGNEYRNGVKIITSGVIGTLPAIYACDFTSGGGYDQANDGQSIACNWLLWGHAAAYLDWSALRPMTELEYEKAGRGNQAPVVNEYPWGNATISGTGATSITNPGANNEIAQAGANCVYNFAGGVQGPMRSGNFAQGATTRSQSGASYYGIMELSGNLYEQLVTVGNSGGRAFTGTKGNGVLDGLGNANVTSWPLFSHLGLGYRGGNWGDSALRLRLSDRDFATETFAAAYFSYFYNGGRGCRLAP
jgi:formylglycine-generating enzyme required for sulfatase activity